MKYPWLINKYAVEPGRDQKIGQRELCARHYHITDLSHKNGQGSRSICYLNPVYIYTRSSVFTVRNGYGCEVVVLGITCLEM